MRPRVALALAVAVLATGAAIAIAWGWTAVAAYCGFVAVSTLLGIVLAVLNRSGGDVAQSVGRLTYDRWMGDRR